MTSASKAVELQLQVKHNAEELQDFMRDLEHWEKDMKEKDLELRRQGGVAEEVSERSLLMCSGTYLSSVCVPRGCACTNTHTHTHTHQHATAQDYKSKDNPLGLVLSCGLQESNLSQQACNKHFDLPSHVIVKFKL